MRKKLAIITLTTLLYISSSISIFSSNLAHAELACEETNANLQAMKSAVVSFELADGKSKEIKVRVADTIETRAAGFQRVCESTIAAIPILFVFQSLVTPSFHMNNVVAPIDIAFIDQNGRIDSIQAMQTYVLGSTNRPLYSSKDKIIAALEVRPGFYSDNKIDLSSVVSWKIMDN